MRLSVELSVCVLFLFISLQFTEIQIAMKVHLDPDSFEKLHQFSRLGRPKVSQRLDFVSLSRFYSFVAFYTFISIFFNRDLLKA